jgi:hypothetical protein
MGISVPSTQYIVELSRLFVVTTDYLLCAGTTTVIDATGLTEKDILLLNGFVQHLREKNRK